MSHESLGSHRLHDLQPCQQIVPGANTMYTCGRRLNQEINAIAASPDFAPVLESNGTLPEATSPAAFAGRNKDELGQWKQIATEHKIVAE